MTKDEIYAHALALQPTEREALAEQLLLSVTEEEQAVIDAARLSEVRRRGEQFRQGRMPTSPVDDVIARVGRRSQR